MDANPATLQRAVLLAQAFSNIHYQCKNIFAPAFQTEKFDIVLLCTVCHHFSDTELIQLLQQLTHQVNVAIIINDLHRHWLAYFAIKGIVRGTDNLRDYFTRRQLQKFSTLHFQLLDVFNSPQSIVLYYKINRGLLAAEVMILNSDMKATKVYANYDKNDVG